MSSGSAWDSSWGDAWGNTWGEVEATTPISSGGAPRNMRRERLLADDEALLLMFAQAFIAGRGGG
jgi:hypothetical protein